MIELGEMGLVFNPYRGKMAQIPSDATPFPHRKGNLFKARYSVSWKDPSPAAAQNFLNQTRELHSCMTPYVSKNPRSAFLNYRDLDIGVNSFGKNSFQEVYGAKYFNDNLQRLVKVKTAVDPENFFRNEQSIPIWNFHNGFMISSQIWKGGPDHHVESLRVDMGSGELHVSRTPSLKLIWLRRF
ncbi:Berberine bridge enzyme-like 21 [Glycine soja]|uniref:Berberine bridge enzyme-like 21 n=1 Tax=Glycine soja TaxID=3848 RepID=A0A445GT14_GLYSO|nr:Berberine bridge enzyme-like 21 [Glycine soja]